jgi:hypothetical protein
MGGASMVALFYAHGDVGETWSYTASTCSYLLAVVVFGMARAIAERRAPH